MPLPPPTNPKESYTIRWLLRFILVTLGLFFVVPSIINETDARAITTAQEQDSSRPLTAGLFAETLTLPSDGSEVVETITVSSVATYLYIELVYFETASVLLEDPSGQVVAPTAEVMEDVDVEAIIQDTTFNNGDNEGTIEEKVISRQYDIVTPIPGEWRLVLSGDGTKEDYAVVNISLGDAAAPKISVISDYSYVVTDPVTVSVGLFRGTLPIQDATVELTFHNTDKETSIDVLALDNGIGGDNMVGDGLYTFSETLEEGFYYVTTSATLADGRTVDAMQITFRVFEVTARIKGTVSDEERDSV